VIAGNVDMFRIKKIFDRHRALVFDVPDGRRLNFGQRIEMIAHELEGSVRNYVRSLEGSTVERSAAVKRHRPIPLCQLRRYDGCAPQPLFSPFGDFPSWWRILGLVVGDDLDASIPWILGDSHDRFA
jgi:hypothetical protein